MAFEETNPAHDAVAAGLGAGPAGAAADGEGLQPHREAPLQDLGVGEARIGHVGVNARGAGPAGAGAPAPPQMVS